jgi:hypothetical protein
LSQTKRPLFSFFCMSAPSLPNPALVTQASARAMPRWVLLLLCVLYALPGFIGRDPWRAEDLLSFGYMLDLAAQLEQAPSWWHIWGASPQILGLPMRAQDSAFTHWLGAWSIHLTSGLIKADVAAKLPFIAMVWASMSALWYGVYALARLPQAQPVALAFGGQAQPTDYARALADGALLALMAALGMAQIGHEATPTLGQFLAISVAFCAAAQWLQGQQHQGTRWLLTLASGLLLACNFMPWLTHGFAAANNGGGDWSSWGKQLVWFAWPTWLLAAWGLLRWRRHLRRPWHRAPHVLLPVLFVLVPLVVWHFNAKGDRSLFLALPGLSALAAFALPTLRRSVIALIDWFSLLFFSLCAAVIGVVSLSLSTGWPHKPAQNVYRLLPGYEHSQTWGQLALGCLVLAAWIYLVYWRTQKHRPALWKSLILPAAGATMTWALLMTLWLPLLNYARSDAPITQKISALLQNPQACVWIGEGVPPSLVTALQWHGGLRLARPEAGSQRCDWLITPVALSLKPSALNAQGWMLHSRIARPSQKGETLALWQRGQQ